mmetsp:Transcript_36005/g.55331  ORF Transcript_36005/g.55331 Transcript_36005/m.55331 type:complete len:204 (-) Transcript_36005:134-745(-)
MLFGNLSRSLVASLLVIISIQEVYGFVASHRPATTATTTTTTTTTRLFAAKKEPIWVPVSGLESSSDLIQEEGQVQLVDTGSTALVNKGTNPTGAVGVIKFGNFHYCFASNCARCKFPLIKAKLYPPTDETNGHARLQCDFCKSTYNLRTGEPVKEPEEGAGGNLFGGLVKGLFSAQENMPMQTFDLAEDSNGKVLINVANTL